MLARDLKDNLNNESRRKLEIIRGNTQQMAQLIDDLLALSRLGRQALNPALLDIEKIFHEAWKELCRSTPGRNARLNLRDLKTA